MSGSTTTHRRVTARRSRLPEVVGLVVAVALLALLPATSVRAAEAGEGMQSFNAVYDVQADGSMRVTENITWRFPAGQERHGIFRNIVVRMGGNDEPNRYRFFDLTDVDVRSPSGSPDGFTVSDNGAAQEI